MMKKLTLALLLLVATHGYAAEPGDNYIGVQFGQSTFEEKGFPDIENTYGLLRMGVYVSSAMALDVRYGDGIDDDEFQGADVFIDRIAGLYLLYHLELSSVSSIYGLIGYTEVELKAENNGGSFIVEENDISYGIGLNFGNLNLEFLQYLDESDYDANAVSIGYTHYFE